MGMALVEPERYVWSVAFLVVAIVCLELSLTVYNGFLPEIADAEEMNRVSALGMGWGYLGGGLALLGAIWFRQLMLSSGRADEVTIVRYCLLGTGVWWLLFSIPAIWVLRDRGAGGARQAPLASIRSAGRDVVSTLYELKKRPTLGWFLVAFLFFNDGVQTVISQSSTFAIRELSFTTGDLAGVILMVQFVATPGALLFGWIADRLGQKNGLFLCLLIWIGLLLSAAFVYSKFAFWIMAVGVALVLGGTQSISRAIMGAMTPEEESAKYFGFFNLSGKATSFLGTFFFGLIVMLSGSARLAIILLLIFFVIGLVIIWPLDIRSAVAKEAKRRLGKSTS